jgi:hypothetical protein
MVLSTLGIVCTTGGGKARTELDADREANVGARPSGAKLGGIPHGNPAGMAVGAKCALAAGTVEETITEMTVLWGGVEGVGDDWLWAAMNVSIRAVNLATSSLSLRFSCSK